MDRMEGATCRQGPWMFRASSCCPWRAATVASLELRMAGPASAFVAKAPANVDALLRSHPLLEPWALKIRFHASIAGFDFVREPGALKIGDASAVWPPLVGDGMSRALGAGIELANALAEGRPAGLSADAMQFALSKAMHSLMLSKLRQAGFWPHAEPGAKSGSQTLPSFPWLILRSFHEKGSYRVAASLGSFTFYACHPYVSHPSTGALAWILATQVSRSRS